VIPLFARWDRSIWSEPGSALPPLILPGGFRYWVIPTAVVFGAILISANYLHRLYQLPRLGLGLRRIISLVFAIGYPALEIRDGESALLPDEENLLHLVGGPGYLRIRPGSAVLLESMTQPTRVLGVGIQFISRFESLREIISLEDQQGSKLEVLTTTRDGIEVAVQNIQYRYRLRTGHRPRGYHARTPGDPYPFSTQALQCFAYRRAVSSGEDGLRRITPWDRAVQLSVEGVITGYISSHLFDEICTPNDYAHRPRRDIARQMQVQAYQNLRNIGTELLWFDIGHFTPVWRNVANQRAETWGAKWSGLAGLQQAVGESTRLKLQDIGRAEAQAEMLRQIVLSIGRDRLSSFSTQNLRNLIIIRTAQILETMVESGYIAASRDQLPQSLSVTLGREFKR
jgi:hypothetical protein